MEDEKNCKEVHLEKENLGIANRKKIMRAMMLRRKFLLNKASDL